MTTEPGLPLALPVRYASAIQRRAGRTGGVGANLGDAARRQIRAETDLEAVSLWLANYVDSPATHASYRKEADRLLLWALADALQGPGTIAQEDLHLFRAFLAAPDRRNPIWTVIAELKPVSSLTHEDLARYRQFLADPQPASAWITEGGARYATDDPRWRPFAGRLEPASIRQAVVILDSLFGWLVEAGYLRGNPLGLLRQRRRRPARRVTRYLPAVMWQHVKDYVAAMPEQEPQQQRGKARARWLTTLFYLLGLRISEVAAGTMGHFVRELGTDGTPRWWLEVVGKGLKYRRIPVSEELLIELKRYRQAHGLEPLPGRGELTPLLLPYRRRKGNAAGEGVDRKTVHNAIKAVFAKAADWAEARGGEHVEHAAHIRQASAHWLRHTAASHMLDSDLDLRTVRDNLGHDSINTTSQYAHEEDDRRHGDTVANHRMNWR
ncbi:tyrosine-type recombinase/integrase [Paraburkholderia tagetis]|uniref:Tyrosine-type recombinase/integrase n=1 Tax=Paraburkholderia tagetis TaxID=2913261 RepID=A0A9X1RSL5_9BURK|nr:tyrosine-type recombinase/integrase [Paraburkholderia tagetis]MCG5076573.1 tyrosine-type recombinase/integrase [Paraburkholderia tagetis]